ncbi:tyrosine-type recombinase/integrase [Sorangium cellulosum]|uniref:tyrosine-type recombinase/integrase n=1 Tax=Sorangium cellulosum TaxID=56 RepID=UPI001F26A792|nr:tyrosine-type recombinase/integrase [Sorangium cellulosum]
MNFTGIRRALHRHRVRISPVNFTGFPRVAAIIYTSTSADRRTRASRSGRRPSLAAARAEPDAAPPGTASSTENQKPTARTAGRSAGEKRANGSGSVRLRGKTWTARLSLGEAGRPTFNLPTCRTEQEANARLQVLSELAGRLLAAGQIVLGLPLLEQAAAREGNALRDVRLAIDQLCKGEARARATGETTFAEFAERVLSGKLAEQYPDHVKAIRSADDYRSRLAHVLDVLGPVPLVRLTIDHADRATSLLPGHLEPSTRRNVAMVVHRILSLAVYPARLIGSNPLPRGWVPKADHDKAKGYLYPDEDQRLMRSQEIPLCFRIYYGFLIREGMRADEAGQLEWSDVDLDRGAVVLDENKTDDPRAWALSPDVVRALRKWREICPDQVRVFVGKWGNPLPGNNGAERFRFHLRRAGIARPELFETTDSRLNIRLHDTRATFITIKLANDRTETWISDRTGHKSSGQIHHYKRAARKVAELGLGDFAPLDEVIPELARKGRAEGTPAPAGSATRAASAEAAIAPAQTGQAPTPGDLSGPAAADAEDPERARLGPRWAKPTAGAAEPQPEPIEIIDLILDRSAVPGTSLGLVAGAEEWTTEKSIIFYRSTG